MARTVEDLFAQNFKTRGFQIFQCHMKRSFTQNLLKVGKSLSKVIEIVLAAAKTLGTIYGKKKGHLLNSVLEAGQLGTRRWSNA